MKVAMVSEHASPLAVLGGADSGGQNVHVAALSNALARRGMRVSVHTRRDDPALPQYVSMTGGVVVDHVSAGPARPIPKDLLLPHMDEFAERLYESWSTDPPDVVHAHFWMSGRAALAAAAPLGIPVLQTFHALGVVKRRHQADADTSPPCRIDEETRILRDSAGVIATSSDELFELLRLGADPATIEVVPCGVDLDRFCPDGPAEECTPGMRRIVVLSRMVPRKGIDDVIRALAGVSGAELVVAGGDDGDQPERRRLEAIAREAGVARRVQFRGRVGRVEVPALLRSADVVVTTPWYEPFGIVPLEAMACGVPVVASAVGGLVDTVVHGVTGLHVPPRSPERIAHSLRELLSSADLRRSLAQAGARRARTRYGWNRIAASTLRVYQAVAERPYAAQEMRR
jgi:glycosyltransferase involved in cell wall biosynthesis